MSHTTLHTWNILDDLAEIRLDGLLHFCRRGRSGSMVNGSRGRSDGGLRTLMALMVPLKMAGMRPRRSCGRVHGGADVVDGSNSRQI